MLIHNDHEQWHPRVHPPVVWISGTHACSWTRGVTLDPAEGRAFRAVSPLVAQQAASSAAWNAALRSLIKPPFRKKSARAARYG